jgi:hypothetical protein
MDGPCFVPCPHREAGWACGYLPGWAGNSHPLSSYPTGSRLRPTRHAHAAARLPETCPTSWRLPRRRCVCVRKVGKGIVARSVGEGPGLSTLVCLKVMHASRNQDSEAGRLLPRSRLLKLRSLSRTPGSQVEKPANLRRDHVKRAPPHPALSHDGERVFLRHLSANAQLQN